MTPSEIRYGLLTRLAWEIYKLGGPVYILISPEWETTLTVRGRSAQKDVVSAAQHGNSWCVVWRGMSLNADDLPTTARTIARGALLEPEDVGAEFALPDAGRVVR